MIDAYVFSRLPPPPVGLSRDLRVLWALEELGLPYRPVGLDFQTELRTDAHLARSPFAQVPTIDDDGLVLSESGAILLHLAERAGQLADPRRRAEVTRWCFVALTTVEPALGTLLMVDFGPKDDAVKMRERLVGWCKRVLGDVDARLAKQTYLVDDTFTVADILLVTVLRELMDKSVLDGFEHVRAYQKRCEERPAWQRTLDAYEKRLGVAPGSARRS